MSVKIETENVEENDKRGVHLVNGTSHETEGVAA